MNRIVSIAMPFLVGATLLFTTSCKKDDKNSGPAPKDPTKAATPSIDRFSATAGHLQVRTATNGIPAANAPVNFDQGPFITNGLTPTGQQVSYYNFDVQPTTPAPIYVLVKDGNPVAGQNNIIDVIPGEAGYNDFWQICTVTVPSDYVANTITSYAEIVSKGYTVTKTNNLVNCPVVPKGSTATKRFTSEDPGLTLGWYKDMVVYYFNFSEKALVTDANGQVPVAPIYVTFNVNPDQPNGGPASGFEAETGTTQTHNVISVIPSGAGYSPLWAVIAYDNNSFATVKDLTTAQAAPVLVPDAGTVNCPVVSIKQ